jgi:hypothetical protein
MATTTNFGWETPDDTDLVKDGAAAMRTLGNSIDTSFVDLKGGTTGQVLSKASATDLDFTWVTDAAGDITGVTAGTGISGGGTSGTVTVTNSMATAIDAKGDLIAGTAADTFSRLAIGSNDQVLTADSTAATGMKWAAVSGGASGPAFQAYSTPTQSVSSTTNTKATMTNENFDTDNNFASSRFTPTKAGYYLITGSISYTGAANKTFRVLLYKNGSNYANWNGASIGVAVANPTIMTEALIYCNGSTDYVEMYGWTDATSPEFYLSTMQGVWIRS